MNRRTSGRSPESTESPQRPIPKSHPSTQPKRHFIASWLLLASALTAFWVGTGPFAPGLRGNLDPMTWRLASGLSYGAWILLEICFFRFVTRENWRDGLFPIAVSQAPFWAMALGPGWLDLTQWPPPPQYYLLRQAQMVFGLIWMAHLFLYIGWTGRRAVKTNRMGIPILFGFLSLFLFIGATWHTLECAPSGDEPHYLLVMESLVRDGDLDLANNYAREDWLKFYDRGTLQPQPSEFLTPDGKRYALHPLGPILAALPGYFLAGRAGAAWTMSVLASLAVTLTLLTGEAVGFRRATLTRMGWVALGSSPLMLFSGLVFSEVPSAACLALGTWAGIRKKWVLSGGAAGISLWMHVRNAAGILPVALCVLWVLAADATHRRAAWKWSLAAIGPLLILFAFNRCLFGSWNLQVVREQGQTLQFTLRHLFTMGLAHWTDQQSGLWPRFPIFLLAWYGLGKMLRAQWTVVRLAAWSSLVYFTLLCSFFHLGGPPAARYFVPITPWLLLALGYTFEDLGESGALFRVSTVLMGFGFVVNGLLAAIPWMRSDPTGEGWMWVLARYLTGWPIPQWLPSFPFEGVVTVQTYGLALGWVAAALGAAWVLSNRRPLPNAKGNPHDPQP